MSRLSKYIKHLLSFSAAFVLTYAAVGQNNSGIQIHGRLNLNDSWEPNVYISHIPKFEEMYYMSSAMIIAESQIDSLGYFKMNLDFLPGDENLYRLHAVKKGNNAATLILGGKDENHLFLIAGGSSKVELEGTSSYAPFKNVVFRHSSGNNTLQIISNKVYTSDSVGSESSASKRSLINDRLKSDLLNIADTCSSNLVSLYSLYMNRFESDIESNAKFYMNYLKIRSDQKSPYFTAFANHFHFETSVEKTPKATSDNNYSIPIIIGLLLCVTTFLIVKVKSGKNRKLRKLSLQERKVYGLLLQSQTNQEIADELNIGLSTVKSHVSSIFSKLKIKSRKEIVNSN